MTVENQFPYQSFIANGTQTNFALGFYVENTDHFEVKKNDQAVSKNDYSYNSTSNSIVFNTTPKIGEMVEIQRRTTAERATTYKTYNNSFRPEVLNKDIDRIWLKVQELGVADNLLKLYTEKLHIEQKGYIDNQDQVIRQIVADLRTYVDQQDNNLNSHFESAISKQGLSLKQLNDFYNQLMQRISAIAVENGWDTGVVTDGWTDKTQAQLNIQNLDKETGFIKESSVLLESGRKQLDKNQETISTADYGSVGKAQNIPISTWYDRNSPYYRGYEDLAAVKVDYPHVTAETNSVDWAATQQALKVAGEYGSVKVVGCLFLQEGETITTLTGQKLYGLSNNWFINSNKGNQFVGSLTGQIPKYGIYYDGTTGTGLRLAAATVLENLVIFGKGYLLTDGSVQLTRPGFAELHNATGIELEKFAHFNNCSIYYFKTAVKSVGGNYYSRFTNVEITRCEIGYEYGEIYSQHFYGCTMREVRIPFKFTQRVMGFNWYGGSVEGFLATENSYSIGIPAQSQLNFYGTYFETFEKTIIGGAVFKQLGSLTYLGLYGCAIYLNNMTKFIDASTALKSTVISKGNRLIVSQETSVKAPVYLYINPHDEMSNYDCDGTDIVHYVRGYPSNTDTGSIQTGLKSVIVTDASKFSVGQLLIIKNGLGSGVDLETVVTAVASNTISLSRASKSSISNAVIEIYHITQYVQRTTGLNLVNFNIKFPIDYPLSFDVQEFSGIDSLAKKSRKTAPENTFNGSSSGVVEYVADGTDWNPANKQDGLGAYPVAYRGGRYIPMLGGFAGTITLGTSLTTQVLNQNITATSKVILTPTNVSATNLKIYVSAKITASRFEITATTAPVGTETFDYFIYD